MLGLGRGRFAKLCDVLPKCVPTNMNIKVTPLRAVTIRWLQLT